jgi:hypothetical protein
LVKYNASSAITPDEIALGYVVIYYENDNLGRLMAKVVGNAVYTYITYGWIPYKSGKGYWHIFEKLRIKS